MAMLNAEELHELTEWVRKHNGENHLMKFALEIQDGILLGIQVRFFTLRREIAKETEGEIYSAITILSHQRLFPERSGALKNGILKIDASYLNRRCSSTDIIRALIFIRDDMRKIIQKGN